MGLFSKLFDKKECAICGGEIGLLGNRKLEDGGVRNNTDNDAPKTISSTLIISFDCRFSTMDAAEPGMLGNHIYQLHAKLENGAVKGTYQVRDTGEKRLFRESHYFMKKVQNLVGMYNLAQYNGHSYEVAGLPGDYGVRLEVVYASGERIYAYNNQDNFLTPDAMNELVKLFARGGPVAFSREIANTAVDN